MFKRLAFAACTFAFSGGLAIAAPGGAMPQLPPQPNVHPAGIPAGYVMVSPCVQGMGEHWASPKDLNAPIYGTYHGNVIFSEIMIPLKTMESGFNYPNLRALPGHAIDHVSIEYHPKGHEGMPVPHLRLPRVLHFIRSADDDLSEGHSRP